MTKIESQLKQLEFLNLEYPKNSRYITSLDKCRITCYFDKVFKHILHSENTHLNSITDLIISQGESLELDKHIHTEKFTESLSLITKVIKEVKNLRENLDYIKSQNNQIILELKAIIQNIPSKEEIKDLSFELAHSKPRKLETETKRILDSFDKRFIQFSTEVTDLLKEIKEGVFGY